METTDILIVAALLLLIVSQHIQQFLLKNKQAEATMETEVKEAILSLFLYAEKQGWTGESKMSYVAHKIYDIIPGETLKAVIKEEHITSYLQNLYDSMKK